ncbi:MAG: hypothetical protein FWG77_06990 [Treponema sp.]|nr:hypothetical protein [Treponema sp.]
MSTIQDDEKKYDDEINLLGRVTSIITLILMFSIPIVITLWHKIPVDFSTTMVALSGMIAMFAPAAVIENISYYAVIGAGGVYLCSITGNVMNMKLPSAISGMKIANVEPGSRKGDIISILSIGTSSLVTMLILFLGMIVVARLLAPLLSHPVLAAGFANVMPALLGAVAMPMIIRNWKIALAPFFVSIILCLILGVWFVQRYQSFLLPGIMIISLAAAYGMYRKGMLSVKPAEKGE